MTIKVGVFGAGGRMGTTVCEAVVADSELELVAAVDPNHEGREVAGCVIDGHTRVAAEAGASVVVDFSVADAARTNLPWAAAHGINAVVGTTGLSDDDIATFRELFVSCGCVIAPNFSIGAVLMMRFAELAAPYFETAEIVELHHDGKRDAPSGTAVLTARRMADASADWGADPTEHEAIEGSRGAAGPGGIRVHAVRLHGLVAHQEVLLGTEGQSLTIRHDTFDRTSFMPGVLLAVKRVADLPGLTIGLDSLLGL